MQILYRYTKISLRSQRSLGLVTEFLQGAKQCL
jgi:hypothetical protein